MKTREKGLTLIEVLLGATVAMLLLSSIVGLVKLSGSVFRRGLESQQLARTAYFQFERPREFASTPYDSVAYQDNLVSYLSARDEVGVFRTDSRGCPDWQAYLILTVEDHKLHLYRTPFTGRDPEPIDGESLSSTLTAKGQVIAHDIAALRVEPMGEQYRLVFALVGGGERSIILGHHP